MTTSVKLEFTLPAEVREADDGGAYYVSACPPLDVLSQGDSEEATLANLAEALQLFFAPALALELVLFSSITDISLDDGRSRRRLKSIGEAIGRRFPDCGFRLHTKESMALQ